MEHTANPYLPESEARQLAALQKDILDDYAARKDQLSTEKWLDETLAKHLPSHSEEQIREISAEILETAHIQEQMRIDQANAIAAGRSHESWLASTLQQATANMGAQEGAKYLAGLDVAIYDANEEMRKTLLTQAGEINMNHNLDGFIAEQHHVNSFNLKAQAQGSEYHAEVVRPEPGTRYEKDSVDIIIKDSAGNTVKQYQVKYGATAKDTIAYIKQGNYEGQDIIVPAEQVKEVQAAFPDKKVSAEITAGKNSSDPISKEDVEKLRDKAQQTKNFLAQDWNAYSNKDIALGISKQVGACALQSAALGVGFKVAEKIWNDEPIEGSEIVETAIKTGADTGIKIATASALKVASEKGILTLIPKGTPASTLTTIATVAIENAKIAKKVFNGELTPKEGLIAMEQTTGACVAGIAVAAKGAALGASLGTVLGPIGSAVGGFIGGTVGYIAGSKVGSAVIKGVQKVREAAVSIVRRVKYRVREALATVKNGLRALFA